MFYRSKVFNRVGGTKTIQVDVRIIAATNKDLWQEIDNGHFRADLYYRLNVVSLHIPPLRERREDIPLLSEYFRLKFAGELKKNVGQFTEETIELISNHTWTGNIRELRNIIERAVLVVGENKLITPQDLAFTGKDYFAAGGRDRRRDENRNGESLSTLNLDELESMAIRTAFTKDQLGSERGGRTFRCSARALNYKISQHNITHHGWRKHN